MLTEGKPSTVAKTSYWLNGPRWLLNCSSNWPSSEPFFNNYSKYKEKVELGSREIVYSFYEKQDNPIFIFSLFSSFTKLLRVTAHCLRFFNNLKEAVHKRKYKYYGGFFKYGMFKY